MDSFQCVDIGKIPDLKRTAFALYNVIGVSVTLCLQFTFLSVLMTNAKIFNRIYGIESLSTKFYLDFTVYLLSLVFFRHT